MPIAISAIRARASEAMATESAPTLILGRAADAEVLLRAIESGAVKKTWPVGILSPSRADQGQSIRGVAVLGDFDQLEKAVADQAQRGTTISRVVLTPSAFEPDAKPEAILMKARRLGLDHKPAAVARGWRRSAAAGAGQCRGSAAAAKREDRLSPAGEVRQRQVGDCHRRRRLDRRRNLRPSRYLRRRAAAGDRKFRTGASRHSRNLVGQGRLGPGRGADRRRPRSRPHVHASVRASSSPTSCSMPRR